MNPEYTSLRSNPGMRVKRRDEKSPSPSYDPAYTAQLERVADSLDAAVADLQGQMCDLQMDYAKNRGRQMNQGFDQGWNRNQYIPSRQLQQQQRFQPRGYPQQPRPTQQQPYPGYQQQRQQNQSWNQDPSGLKYFRADNNKRNRDTLERFAGQGKCQWEEINDQSVRIQVFNPIHLGQIQLAVVR